MNAQQFTETIANGTGFGLWSNAAESALKNKQYDLFVDHWREQYEDPGSRPNVKQTLGPDLLKVLKRLITYTYEDLENDLKKLSPEEKQRPVIGWREEEGFKIHSLMNDRQPYFKDDYNSISQTDYNALSPTEREDYELYAKDGVTILIEDF